MPGNQSRGLRIASLTKGWDCTKIEGFDGPEGDLKNFDKDQGNIVFKGNGLGVLPEGTPDSFDKATDSVYDQKVTFNAPDAGRENANRRTSGADPTPQMPGA